MDKNEQKLTEAEKRRLEHFEKTSEEMVRQGYVRQDLTVDIRKANRFGIFLMFPLLIIGYGLYYLIHRRMEFAASSLLIFLLAFFGCIVLHELIHGLSWSIFTPRHTLSMMPARYSGSMSSSAPSMIRISRVMRSLRIAAAATGSPVFVLRG